MRLLFRPLGSSGKFFKLTSVELIVSVESLKRVIGDNVKHLREAAGWTQGQLVDQLRRSGLEISRSSIAWLETGRREPGTAELLLLAQVFDVPVHELVSTDVPEIQLTSEAVMATGALRDLITGEGEPPYSSRVVVPVAESHRARRWGQRLGLNIDDALHAELYFEAEQSGEIDVGNRLGLDPMQVTLLAYALWGMSFSDRRDADLTDVAASPSSMRMLKAHATRRREAELKAKAQEVGWLKRTRSARKRVGPRQK